jgi:hypothetical protein
MFRRSGVPKDLSVDTPLQVEDMEDKKEKPEFQDSYQTIEQKNNLLFQK